MKASIPQEFEDAIHDYIIIQMMIEVLDKKLADGMKVEKVIDKLLKNHAKIKSFMRKHNIKVYEPKVIDEEFVEYTYSIKTNGGYKEGNNRYWRHALRMHMNKRLESLRKKESILTREYD